LSQTSLLKNHSYLIKVCAKELGFSFCGITKAVFLEQEAYRLESWLKAGMHGDMQYMEKYADKRVNPSLLVDDAKSVISLMFNYYPALPIEENDNYKIAKYAYGRDYHNVLKNKLQKLIGYIRSFAGNVNARAFTDSAPVLEKALAQRCGLGWIGKNGTLINNKIGSFLFLSEIILDLELDYDEPARDHCGTCKKCMDACPTGAIVRPYVIDARKCISYLTIEYRKGLPAELKDKFHNWIFGCDICQDVCPWNRFAKSNSEPAFQPSAALSNQRKNDWHTMTETAFRNLFSDSVIKRTGYNGYRRNIEFLR
jgi:epoxyqueuosine reductase